MFDRISTAVHSGEPPSSRPAGLVARQARDGHAVTARSEALLLDQGAAVDGPLEPDLGIEVGVEGLEALDVRVDPEHGAGEAGGARALHAVAELVEGGVVPGQPAEDDALGAVRARRERRPRVGDDPRLVAQ